VRGHRKAHQPHAAIFVATHWGAIHQRPPFVFSLIVDLTGVEHCFPGAGTMMTGMDVRRMT
jgi:hypothetical protein